MNWFSYVLGGVLLGTAVYLILREGEGSRGNQPPVTELAHQLEQAWSDHHTTA